MRVAALVLLCALAAQADGTADEADLHFRLAAEAARKGDYERALEHFFVSNRLAPNRNVLFNIGSVFERMHRYADAHRYYVDAADGETERQALAADAAAIARVAPKVAVLDVRTEPPGATLYIDRKSLGSVGRAPRPLAMPAGKYVVVAELEGYEPAESAPVEASIGHTTQVVLPLTRIVGTVHVEAARAEVRVDGERGPVACVAPCDLQLPPGVHELSFAAPGFRAPPRAVTVVARQTTSVTATLAPLTGSILVEADESSALVTVDGKPAGFTPVVIQNVRAGVRRLRVEKHGYEPLELDVDVQPDQQAQASGLRLEPQREITAASRYAQAVDDAPASVTIIPGEELRAFGYPTIAEALRGVRGFTISNDRAYASASVRGLGQPEDYGNRLLVLSDGQSLNDDIVGSSAIGADARVDLEDVDRIEVVRGPGSLLYGTGALSGAVNLVTRAHDEPDSVHGGLGVYDGVAMHGRLGFTRHFGSDSGVWASVTGARSDGQDLTVAGVPIGGADSFSGGGTAGRYWNGAFTAQWFFNQRYQTIPVGAYATALGDPGTKYRDTRALIELKYEPRVSDTLQLQLIAHGNAYRSHDVFASDPAATEDYASNWAGGEARLVWTPSRALRLTVGGEAQVHPDVTMKGSTAEATYLDESASYRFGAGYLLADVTPARWVTLSAGARVDVYSSFGAIVVPRAALILRPTEGGTLKLMGGRAFRAPSIYEQTYNDGGATQLQAVDLGPESIWSGEIEYSQRFLTDWVGLVAAHASQVDGLIRTVPVGTAFQFSNLDEPARIAGAEVELRRELRRQTMISAQYGFQRAESGGQLLVNAPQHLAGLKAMTPIVPDLALLGVRVALEAPRRIAADSDETTRTAAILDATLSGTVRGLHYVLGIYNLAGQKYEVPVTRTFASRTMPQNGRTLLFDVEARLP